MPRESWLAAWMAVVLESILEEFLPSVRLVWGRALSASEAQQLVVEGGARLRGC